MDSLTRNLNSCQVKISVSWNPIVTVMVNKIAEPIKIENIYRYKMYNGSRIFFYVYTLKVHKHLYIKKSQHVAHTGFRTWYWRVGDMAGGRQDKQAPEVAKKLLKEKITGSSSHCKANCHGSGGVGENIAVQLQEEGVQSGTEFRALGR